MADGRSIDTELLQHPRRWLMVPIRLPLPTSGPFITLQLMLNTGRPESAVCRNTFRTLDALGLLTPVRGSAFVLRHARLEGVALPDIPMRVSVGPGLLGLDGMLRLDFLAQSAEVRLDFQALRLMLIGS